MSPPHHAEAIQREGRMTLAIDAIKKKQFSSGRSAAGVYKVPRTTMQDRRNGRLPKLGSRAKNRLLLESEESVLINWIYSLERRGFPPYIIDVRRMAQTLADQRGSKSKKRVGKLWVYRFL